MDSSAYIRSDSDPVPGEDSGHPGLVLLLGPANSGKMGRLLDWWHDRLAFDPVVVTPTGPDAEELTGEMIRRAGALVGHLPAQTFDGLVAQVLGERPRYAAGLEQGLILQKVLARPELGVLGPMARFPGTLTALSDLLRRVAESGRTPEQVVQLLGVWGRSEPDAAGLAADLSSVVRHYHDHLAAFGLTDRPAAVMEACSRLHPWSRPVAFYGFTSFTPGQRTFIEALAARVPVMLALTFDGSRPVDLVDPAEVRRWRSVACEVLFSSVEARAYSSPGIAFLERSFMAEKVEAPPTEDTSPFSGVKFALSSGQRNEAEAAAEQIARLIMGGFDPGRIGVVVRSVEAWSGLLSQVFRSCGIPFRLDIGRSLRGTGLGNALLCALNAVVHDDAAALLVYLRGPYSGLDPAAVAEAAARFPSREGWVFRLIRALSGGEASSPVLLEAVVGGGGAEAAVQPIGLRRLAADMLSRGAGGVSVLSRDMEEDARTYRAVVAAAGCLERLSRGGDDPSWLSASLVLPALERSVVPPGPVTGQRSVQVLSPHRARARRFDALFVLGLTEGEFPAATDTPSLLSGPQRESVDSLGGGGLFSPDRDREAALFASVVSRAWQFLYLSARDADDGGGESTPSRFWSMSRELLARGEEVDHLRTMADQVFAPERSPSARHHRRACVVRSRVFGGGAGPDDSGVAPASWTRRWVSLREPGVLDDLAGRTSFSPSELETYLTCPFMWFVQRVVRREPMDDELDERAYGQLLHSLLSEVYRVLASVGALPLTQEGVRGAVEAAHGVIERWMADGTCPGSPSEVRIASWRLGRDVEAVLELEAARGGSLGVVDTELSVGGREGVDLGGIRLRGRVDRVDTDPGGELLFVVDYKTGNAPAKSALGTATAIQLPLYLLALGRERPGARVIGGAYLSVKELKYSGLVSADAAGAVGASGAGLREVDEAEEDQILAAALEAAQTAAAGIRGGRIEPPRERDCPGWCELGPVCRAKVGGYRR